MFIEQYERATCHAISPWSHIPCLGISLQGRFSCSGIGHGGNKALLVGRKAAKQNTIVLSLGIEPRQVALILCETFQWKHKLQITSDNVKNLVIHRSLLFKKLAANYHSSDLASACPNLIEFGIAEEASSWVLVHIPITTETLNSLQEGSQLR